MKSHARVVIIGGGVVGCVGAPQSTESVSACRALACSRALVGSGDSLHSVSARGRAAAEALDPERRRGGDAPKRAPLRLPAAGVGVVAATLGPLADIAEAAKGPTTKMKEDLERVTGKVLLGAEAVQQKAMAARAQAQDKRELLEQRRRHALKHTGRG